MNQCRPLSALSQMLRNNGVLCRRRRRPYHCRSYSGSGPLSRSGARGRPDRKRFRAVAWVAPSHPCCTVACGRTGETGLARAHEASCEKHQQHPTSRVRRSPTFANSATATPLSLAKCSCMTCEYGHELWQMPMSASMKSPIASRLPLVRGCTCISCSLSCT